MAGDPACGLLDAELALDRLDAELAATLPAHVRAFAAAYATGQAPPSAPAVTHRASSLAVARRALAHAELADRAWPLVRLIAPVLVDDDPTVTAARGAAPRDWPALATLTRARDAAALRLFGVRFVALVHELHGSARPSGSSPTARLPPPVAGWQATEPAVAAVAVDAVARELVELHGARGTLRIVASPSARPRAFVVEPGREVIVVVPAAIDTALARFQTLHELGHAVAALLSRRALPRVVDEAAAAYVARRIERSPRLERGGRTDDAWTSVLAGAARARRTMLAAILDDVERALPTIDDVPTPQPPWALWHDAGAQAAYGAAEVLAERWWTTLGPAPAAGALATALARAADDVDRAASLR